MKRLLVLFVLLSATFGFAQVNVSGALVGNGTYTTLTDAFTAINGGAQTSATISISITASTTEPAAGAILNAGTWTSISIQPSGGAWTVSGSATAGLPLIDLNGADNVTFNGLNSGGNSLTIENTTASATSGTSTIRFIADATNNTITNCAVLGAFSAAVTTNGGNIFFSTATTTGNDNNTISNCNIGPSGLNLPTKGIYGNGTTTSTSFFNSGVTITGNNIYDYFGAALSSAGVYVGGGCTDWTISNNKFYQTATITQTTGSQHSAIWISNTTGSNFSISGNTIGYASNSGTGTYTFVGASASKLIPIFLSVGTTTVTSVQGNTITAMAMSGASSGTSSSAPFRGIYVSSGLTTIGDVIGNTFGSMSATNSITFTSSSTSASDVMGIFNFGSSNWTVSNNNIGGITASNSSTGAANVFGIRLNTSSTATTLISNNTIGGSIANSLQSGAAAATAGTQVVGIYVSTSISTVSGNTIRNLTAPGGTGTTTGASVIGINFISATPIQTVSRNTIYNLANTNTTAATIVTGIQFTGGTGNVVERNLIYALTSATNSASAEVNGIRVAVGTTIYRNNMIAIGEGISNALGGPATNSSTAGINGINGFLGTDQMFHNSVYIGGTATAGGGASYAFNGTQTVNTRSFRNNIFFNARTNSGATGTHYAIKLNGTVANPTGLTINNNVYFANGTGAVFGFYNSLDVANLAAWKTAVGQDAGSFESNPQYNNPTAATPDLHIHPTNLTVIEGNGADVGVLNDYDNETRSGLTPVDIGADAGNFSGIDLAGPIINYSLLLNSSDNPTRSLLATITDVSGVNGTAGTAPRVFFKKKTDNNAFGGNTSTDNGWKWTETTGSSPFSLVINYNILLGGLASPGDTIQYFVVAQDLAGTPNVSANPSAGFVGTSVSSITSAPSTPNQYKVVGNPLLGDYTVGTLVFNKATGRNIKYEKRSRTVIKDIEVIVNQSEKKDGLNGGQSLEKTEITTFDAISVSPKNTVQQLVTEAYYTLVENGKEYNGTTSMLYNAPENGIEGVYATLTAAINDLNERGASGNVRFLLNDPTFTEAGTLLINIAASDTLNASRTLTIKPNTGVTTTVTTNSTSPVFTIVEHYVTIDGSNTLNGTTRDMTITNSGTASTSGVAFVAAMNNVTIKNIIGSTNSSATSYGIVYDASNNGLVENCELKKATLGIQSQTSSNNFIARKNIVGSTVTADKFQTAGISILSSTNFTVDSNRVFGVTRSSTANVAGIIVGVQTGGIQPLNGTITRNDIQDVKHTGLGTSCYGAFGIQLSGTNLTSNVTVANNFISDIFSDGDLSATFSPHGIYIISGGGYNIYFNSVNISGNVSSNGDADLIRTGAITINFTTAANLDIRNNILVNNQEITGTNASAKAHAIYCGSPASAFTKIDYNNYYASNVNDGVLGYLGSDRTTLSDWQTATSQDANSKSAAVTFAGPTDLHLSGGSVGDGNLAATPVVGVTTDFDNEARNAYWPYMGADEVTASPLALKLTLKALIEGFYANSFNDTISVVLSQTIAPYNKLAPVKGLTSASGVDFYLPKGGETSYYIVLKHRNSVETWSASTVATASFPLTYDFTSAAGQAFGSNMILVGGKWCIFGGDLTSSTPGVQDGLVDGSDLASVDNDNTNFVTGYVVTDLTGEQIVDGSDLAIVDNNNTAFVGKVVPPGALTTKRTKQPITEKENK